MQGKKRQENARNGKCEEWKTAGNMTSAATERSAKWHYNNDYG